jgi:hypothetical protein
MNFEDLSKTPGKPRDRIVAMRAVSAARAGCDIMQLAPVWWKTCSVCDVPSIEICGQSVCCEGAIRIQGWVR